MIMIKDDDENLAFRRKKTKNISWETYAGGIWTEIEIPVLHTL